jgi:hypothetical protein
MSELDDFLKWADVHRSSLRREIRSLQAMPIVDEERVAGFTSVIEAIEKMVVSFTELDRKAPRNDVRDGQRSPQGASYARRGRDFDLDEPALGQK